MTTQNKPTYKELEALVYSQQLQINSLQEQVKNLQAKIQMLTEQLAKANKNSSNSSKPPSSDIVKPKKDPLPSGEKRKQGAQFGHKKHENTLGVSDAATLQHYRFETCPACSGTVIEVPDVKPKTFLQYEIDAKTIKLTAHIAPALFCKNCNSIHFAQIPAHVRNAGLVGPRVSAFIAILKGGCHASVANTQKVIKYLGAPLAEGTICKILHKVEQALDAPYIELLEQLPMQAQLNIDETGHKDQGSLYWTWCFVAAAFTVFKIAASRSSEVLLDVLGKQCAAVIGSDYYGAYRKYMKQSPVLVQFCMAHLIRELLFISELPTPAVANYGKELLTQIKTIFELIHQRNDVDEKWFRKRMKKLQKKFLQSAGETIAGGAAATLAKRFKTHGEAYFTFVLNPGIGPTNNIVERALRFCVIDRRVTQGTRGINGQRWCERIWTTLATCAQRNMNAFDFINTAVSCYFSNLPAPSLLK